MFHGRPWREGRIRPAREGDPA